MNDEDWQQVRTIFESAVLLSPEQRREFVRMSCGSDQLLLNEVTSLLSSLDSADAFMEQPAVTKVADFVGSGASRLEPGTRIGAFEILKQIGRGGMGEVYLARDFKLDREVAIKILSREFGHQRANLDRFVREAKTASALNHPNILVIHEIGDLDGEPYIVSEFVRGSTLRDALNGRTLRLSDILDISIQVADALAAAHQARVVHRDVKPENLIIRPDRVMKVLDFGLAKLVSPLSAAGLEESTVGENRTADGIVLGTVSYMSPEQAKGEHVDERTDIFSLGVVVYEMLAGCSPFAGASVAETFANLIKTEPEPLSICADHDVPEDLERIVGKMLQKDKERRYQNMMAVLTDLKEVRESHAFQKTFEAAGELNGKSTAAQGVATSDAGSMATEVTHGAGLMRGNRRYAVFAATVLLFGAAGLWLLLQYSTTLNNNQSIAVLPFNNQTGDSALDYLSDGLSESVIDRLSGLPQVKVVARNSSFRFRGLDDWQHAAATLGVKTIVTGRVTLRGDTLSVRVDLMDVQTNRQLWGQQYEGRVMDAAQIQDEIARAISDKLSLKFTDEQQKQLARTRTANPQAYTEVMKGRYYSLKGGAEDWKKAVDHFEAAIAVDANYAPAYSGLFWVYRNLMARGVLNSQEFIPKAVQAARRALELDQDLAEAHLAIGYIKRDAWSWRESEASFKRALEINPNMAAAHGAYSAYLAVMGRHDEAVARARRAVELDPFSPLFNSNSGFILFLARRYDDAISSLKETIALDANNSNAHLLLGLSYTEKDSHAEAIAAYEEAIRLDKVSPNLPVLLAAGHARAGDRAQAEKIFTAVLENQVPTSPAYSAIYYASLGDKDHAFASLEKAIAVRDMHVQHLAVSPAYEPLRSDPRMDELLTRMGLK